MFRLRKRQMQARRWPQILEWRCKPQYAAVSWDILAMTDMALLIHPRRSDVSLAREANVSMEMDASNCKRATGISTTPQASTPRRRSQDQVASHSTAAVVQDDRHRAANPPENKKKMKNKKPCLAYAKQHRFRGDSYDDRHGAANA